LVRKAHSGEKTLVEEAALPIDEFQVDDPDGKKGPITSRQLKATCHREEAANDPGVTD
jgi:hypothetical protein